MLHPISGQVLDNPYRLAHCRVDAQEFCASDVPPLQPPVAVSHQLEFDSIPARSVADERTGSARGEVGVRRREKFPQRAKRRQGRIARQHGLRLIAVYPEK